MPLLIASNVPIDVPRGNPAAIGSRLRLAHRRNAIENVLTIITLNRKHYHMIDGLKIQVPDY